MAKRKRISTAESIASDLKKRIQKKLMPTRRGSRPKSGYAFSHERGFGHLIVSGLMGSKRRKKVEQSKGNESTLRVRGAASASDVEGVVIEAYRPIQT